MALGAAICPQHAQKFRHAVYYHTADMFLMYIQNKP